jgi:inhibitor of cysteine peptidase
MSRLTIGFTGFAVCLAAIAGAILAQSGSAPAPATASTPATATAPEPATKAADLAVTEADNGKTLTMGNHKTATISLAGNATTGYSWTVTKTDGAAFEQVGTVDYVPDRSPPGMVGTGGTSVVKFKAVKVGQSTITMGYARPWETGKEPAKTFTVTLVVDKVP